MNLITLFIFQVMSNREDANAGVGDRYDMSFSSWFESDCLLANLRTEIESILVKPSSDDTIPGSDSSDGGNFVILFY